MEIPMLGIHDFDRSMHKIDLPHQYVGYLFIIVCSQFVKIDFRNGALFEKMIPIVMKCEQVMRNMHVVSWLAFSE